MTLYQFVIKTRGVFKETFLWQNTQQTSIGISICNSNNPHRIVSLPHEDRAWQISWYQRSSQVPSDRRLKSTFTRLTAFVTLSFDIIVVGIHSLFTLIRVDINSILCVRLVEGL